MCNTFIQVSKTEVSWTKHNVYNKIRKIVRATESNKICSFLPWRCAENTDRGCIFYCTIKLFWFLICKLQKNRLKRVHNRIDLEDLQWIIIATIILANLLMSLFKFYNRIYLLTWMKKRITLKINTLFSTIHN